MKILLTGATGFLGSHLLKALTKRGHEVVILKRSFSDTRRINECLDKVKSYDVDKMELAEIFESEKDIDSVIHTATCYGRNNEPSSYVLKTNVAYSLDILENVIKYPYIRFINIDSILDRRLNRYALSKEQFVEWGEYYGRIGKLSFSNLQFEHIYGPFDDESKFITHCIHKLKNNVPFLELTGGEQKRDFIYVDDAVLAIITVLEREKHLLGFGNMKLARGQPTTSRRCGAY